MLTGAYCLNAVRIIVRYREFIKHLRDANKSVYLITGGFDCLIEPIANELNIPLENMFANKLFFHFNGKYIFRLAAFIYLAHGFHLIVNLNETSIFVYAGDYAGFDVNQPTSRTGGKGEAITIVRRSMARDVNITMIGDGATDLEASPPADNFIGYGGNIVREEVRNRAHYYATSFDQLY